ncbi:phenolic glucoside malonyltransferase 1-like [Salvia miltiorrhiza]|uniref:phenolic glucoside malonyltransferase 1-like n=1 Tax=Salvia miltiorrhiza TaxID=226208 RepID=UPI0025AD7912|nr:phenolic glucoside malonyltransferase 1-like [Salvia miltiorrhiza]
MTATTKTLSVLHRGGVAPASDAAEQRLPLTYFDMFWLYFHPIERLFFYKHPCSVADFTDNIVPQLRNSLSQTLSHYLPLAGNLFRPLDSSMPELRYSSGDSVAVTFAEYSEAADFEYLTGNQAREADEFHLFVPQLPESTTDSESGCQKFPLLAIKVTLFPATGIVIGVTNHHVAGDASSIVGFLKAWSSTVKLGGEGDFEQLARNNALPFYDRSVIRDPTARAEIYWNQMRSIKLGESQPGSITPTNKVRETFILQKTDIEKLKKMVMEREPDSIHLSSFTVTLAYFWSCIDRTAAEAGEEIGDEELEYFGFAVDARGRADPPVPAAYFGNCVAFVVAESRHGVMRGEDGFFAAAKLVGELIRDKVNKKGELLSDADEWLTKYAPLLGRRVFGVAGSPKFDVYGVDFGWGKAAKYEAVSIDGDPNVSISLCKSREFEGGLELGVSMPKRAVEALAAVFYHGLKA